jgi:hypothetical protein
MSGGLEWGPADNPIWKAESRDKHYGPKVTLGGWEHNHLMHSGIHLSRYSIRSRMDLVDCCLVVLGRPRRRWRRSTPRLQNW